MDLCKYKDIFGAPNTGLHSFRIFNIAIIDVLFTFIAAYFISYFTNFPFLIVLIFLFLLGVFLHRIFCVKTTVDKLLFSQ